MLWDTCHSLRSQQGLENAIKILEEQFDLVESVKAEVAGLQSGKLPPAQQTPLLDWTSVHHSHLQEEHQ